MFRNGRTYEELNKELTFYQFDFSSFSTSSIIRISTTSIEMIIMFGYFESGKAYLPLDPSHPHDRL
jgi:hypothetical protein